MEVQVPREEPAKQYKFGSPGVGNIIGKKKSDSILDLFLLL